METVVEFRKQQAQTKKVLEKLLDFLEKGKKYGAKIDPKYKLKLEEAIKAAADGKLNVALIGGANEGKTSIVAAWTEKYDKKTMKINQQESTNEVSVYSMEDFNIVDTPGLFGFKENINKEKYKDITKKYVSQAHIVLYVMGPSNPVKESHKKEFVWLFRDLNLLPRTVFVLSKFDRVADIEDDDDYNARLDIKKKNVIGALKDFGLISNEDIKDIAIVAVSANPFEKGVKHWLSHLEKFKRLSHIESLQIATTKKIKTAGTSSAIEESKNKAIAIDILKQHLPVAIEHEKNSRAEYERFQQLYDEVEKKFIKTESNLRETKKELRQFIKQLFTKDLIFQANRLSMETIGDFFEHEIGDKGNILTKKVHDEFKRQLDIAYQEIDSMQKSLNASLRQYKNIIGKGGGNHAKEIMEEGGKIIVAHVPEIVKHVMALFKFKPWNLIKLASNINALPIGSLIGIALEIWDSYNQKQKEKEFQKGIEDIVSKFERQQKEFLDFLDDDDKFKRKCFPGYAGIEKKKKELHMVLQKKHLRHENFKNWLKTGKEIEKQLKLNQ